MRERLGFQKGTYKTDLSISGCIWKSESGKRKQGKGGTETWQRCDLNKGVPTLRRNTSFFKKVMQAINEPPLQRNAFRVTSPALFWTAGATKRRQLLQGITCNFSFPDSKWNHQVKGLKA